MSDHLQAGAALTKVDGRVRLWKQEGLLCSAKSKLRYHAGGDVGPLHSLNAAKSSTPGSVLGGESGFHLCGRGGKKCPEIGCREGRVLPRLGNSYRISAGDRARCIFTGSTPRVSNPRVSMAKFLPAPPGRINISCTTVVDT